MKRIIAYGSLRKHSSRGHNFDRFGEGSQTFIKFVELEGWDLFPIAGGSYPAITMGSNKLIAELHEVTDDAFFFISNMETASGYIEGKVKVDDKDAYIYYMPASHMKGRKPIESGNWS